MISWKIFDFSVHLNANVKESTYPKYILNKSKTSNLKENYKVLTKNQVLFILTYIRL